MSGDDDDIIIHRVNHQTQADQATPINTSRALFAELLSLLPSVIGNSGLSDLRNSLVSLTS